MGRSGSLEAGGAGLGLGRSMSGQLHRARSSSTKCGALATIAEHTGLGKDALLNLVSNAGSSAVRAGAGAAHACATAR